ncbi:MAG: 3-phosphoglycerate dehydrogenase [Bacteroidetes bacterium CG18_big_fil_WC_8_21_14_2_50_41_14]|nr:MAG: 3-phosphoglycerate dehydrogenase [Bacteroidetes bacterium CG18_big_fil_WC_8_21_14_2_50_41_14]PJB58701.1 MAG: 3-phosphoglycerate dehydrogenase [Bacteroidetes bacterium CG_4_9_14_3_um_filter_41_19]
MTKVLVATDKPFAAGAAKQIKAVIEEAGFTCAFLEKYTSPQELILAVADVEAIIIRSDLITKEVMEAAPNLKIVVRAGAGYDNVDLQSATAHKVVVMNTPGQNSNAVAELALGMMVYQARNQFNGTSGTELFGKKLGIHAYGNVGKHVARIARGFGMEVSAFDPFVNKAVIEADGVTAIDNVDDLYSTCDYISLHIPANASTKQSIGFDLLSKTKKSAMLVNTARKEVINEAGLLKWFETSDSFKYVSDVAPDNYDLLKEKFGNRCFCTPKKMGAQTAEANNNAGVAAARQIIGFIKQGDTTYQVN